MLIEETADIVEAATNSRISKTNDFGSGCSADGNLVVDERVYDAILPDLQTPGAHGSAGRTTSGPDVPPTAISSATSASTTPSSPNCRSRAGTWSTRRRRS